MDVAKLKVVELRSELASRGLDTKGVKSVLAARLQEALDAEEGGDDRPSEAGGGEEPDDEMEETPAQLDETSAQSVASSEHEASHQGEDSSQFVSFQDESESKPAESEVNDDSVDNVAEESSDKLGGEAAEESEDSSQPLVQREESRDSSNPVAEREEPVDFAEVLCQREETRDSSAAGTVDEASVQSALGEISNDEPEPCLQGDEPFRQEGQDLTFDQNSSSNVQEQEQESVDTWNQPADVSQQPSFHLEDSNAQDALDAEETLRASEENAVVEEKMQVDEQSETHTEESKPETEEKPDVKPKKEEREPRERRKNRWDTVDPNEVKEELQPLMPDFSSQPSFEDSNSENKVKEESEERERKRSRDGDDKDVKDRDRGERDSRKRERSGERRYQSPPRRVVEDEPEFDENAVLLSWYDSDLHVIINKGDFCSASLINDDGFGYVWAGVRATYGYEKGMVYYEVKITANQDTTSLEDEPTPHVLRAGWSIQDSSLQLGEEPLSYGYGGTGKVSCDCKFRDYGKPFVVNDVIGCYLDLSSDTIQISYTLNGESLGVAYSIERDELKGKALFPHILSKNCEFAVNFGQVDPWSAPLPDFINVGHVIMADRVAGRKRPEKREECEAIMMIGLPGSGKTTWAMKFASENKEKMYNILGTNALIDKMKVMGMPRRRNYSGRWDGLISKCTKCLNTLLEIASKRRRNYILDQTNVYPTAQKRKMRGFDGFIRRAVVVVPTDDELKARTAKREAEEGKDVPDSAVLEMKANFLLPTKIHFDAIDYVELNEEEAEKLVKEYNKEGNDAGYESKFAQPYKRPRMDDGFRGGEDRSRRGGYGHGGYGGRDARSGGGGGGGGYRSGGGGGGFGGDRGSRGGRFGGDRGGRSRFDDNRGPRGDRGERPPWRDRGDHPRPRSDERGWGSAPRGGRGGESRGGGQGWRDNRGGSGWGGGRDDSASPRSGGGGKYERNGRGREDDKDRGMGGGPRGWSQAVAGGPEASGGRGGGRGGARPDNRGYGGGSGTRGGRGDGQMQGSSQGQNYQQGWPGYGNQWGQWNQNYNATPQQQQQQQQQWKGYGQQNWNQQNWMGQWGNWNQGYYNQGYPQTWGQTGQAGAAATTDSTQQAQQQQTAATTAYSYGQTGQTGAWPGYGMGYGAMAGTAGAAQAQQQPAGAASYPSQQKPA